MNIGKGMAQTIKKNISTNSKVDMDVLYHKL